MSYNMAVLEEISERINSLQPKTFLGHDVLSEWFGLLYPSKEYYSMITRLTEELKVKGMYLESNYMDHIGVVIKIKGGVYIQVS